MGVRGVVSSGARRCRRTMAAAGATVLAVSAALALSPAGHADSAGPHRGTAKATAVVARVAPGVGSLELAIGSGIAVTELTNTVAEAQAQAVDLGLIGTTLTAGGCSDALLTADDLPQPTTVDNRKGNTSVATDEVPVSPGLGGGRKVARATVTPLGHALASGVELGLPGLLTLRAGRADATTSAVEGGREARASVEVSLDVAGLVTLRGLRWEATHRSGTEPAASGSFELAGLASLGIPLPVDDLGPVQALLDRLLAPVGISIELPRVQRLTEPADLVRVTPLRILLKDTPLGKAVLGPVLNATRVLREQMFDAVSGAFCQAAGVLLVGDVATSVASGTGFLAIEIGGVEATSADLEIEDPFGAVPPATAGPAAQPAASPTSGPTGVPAPTAGAPAAPTAERQEPLATPVSDVGPLERVCESVHPFDWPSCSHGAALPLGLAGLGVTAAMAALDFRHQRRLLDAPLDVPEGAPVEAP